MVNPILSQFKNDVWMMEPKKLSALFGQFLNISAESLSNLMAIEIIAKQQALVINSGIATINIHGILMKDPPGWLKFFGIETTDYNVLRGQLAEAVNNKDVQSIFLHIDSPGGTVAGASEAAEAIANTNKSKPVSAYIEDLGASGAYYLASQAGKITANPNAEVGSIGVYTVYVDYSKFAENIGAKVIVIRSGEHKGMGIEGAPITEQQISAIQAVIDGMAANFKAAVSAGRKLSIENVEQLATGQVWIAKDAKELKLIDEIVNGANGMESRTSNGGTNKSAQGRDLVKDGQQINKSNLKGNTMPDEQNLQNEKAAADNAIAAERKRVSDIKSAFPNDAAFALEQIENGKSLLEAKAAHAEVLQTKNTALEADKAELQKKVDAKAEGGDVVVSAGEGGGGTADFLAVAKQLAKDEKITKAEAMKKVAKEQPELYEAYITASQAKATAKK